MAFKSFFDIDISGLGEKQKSQLALDLSVASVRFYYKMDTGGQVAKMGLFNLLYFSSNTPEDFVFQLPEISDDFRWDIESNLEEIHETYQSNINKYIPLDYYVGLEVYIYDVLTALLKNFPALLSHKSFRKIQNKNSTIEEEVKKVVKSNSIKNLITTYFNSIDTIDAGLTEEEINDTNTITLVRNQITHYNGKPDTEFTGKTKESDFKPQLSEGNWIKITYEYLLKVLGHLSIVHEKIQSGLMENLGQTSEFHSEILRNLTKV